MTDTPKRTFQVVDLYQQMIAAGQPIPDLEATKLEALPLTLRRHEYSSHLTTLDSPFGETMAQNVAEFYALRECGYAEHVEFDLLVFEETGGPVFRVAVQTQRQPVAECLALVQVTP